MQQLIVNCNQWCLPSHVLAIIIIGPLPIFANLAPPTHTRLQPEQVAFHAQTISICLQWVLVLTAQLDNLLSMEELVDGNHNQWPLVNHAQVIKFVM
jgi:Mg2+/Co2+ transporter CorB